MVGFLPDLHCFRFSDKSKGKIFLTSQNGGAVPLHTRAPAPAYASGSAQGRQMRSAPATAHTLSALPELAPASLDAPVSDAGDLFKVLRLILLTDLHKAKRAHRPTARIAKRLRDVTARLAAQ